MKALLLSAVQICEIQNENIKLKADFKLLRDSLIDAKNVLSNCILPTFGYKTVENINHVLSITEEKL